MISSAKSSTPWTPGTGQLPLIVWQWNFKMYSSNGLRMRLTHTCDKLRETHVSTTKGLKVMSHTSFHRDTFVRLAAGGRVYWSVKPGNRKSRIPWISQTASSCCRKICISVASVPWVGIWSPWSVGVMMSMTVEDLTWWWHTIVSSHELLLWECSI